MTNSPTIIQNNNPNLYLLNLDYFKIDKEEDVITERERKLFECPVIAFSITVSENPRNKWEGVSYRTEYIGWEGSSSNSDYVIVDKSTWHFYAVEDRDGWGQKELLAYLNEHAQSDLKHRIRSSQTTKTV